MPLPIPRVKKSPWGGGCWGRGVSVNRSLLRLLGTHWVATPCCCWLLSITCLASQHIQMGLQPGQKLKPLALIQLEWTTSWGSITLHLKRPAVSSLGRVIATCPEFTFCILAESHPLTASHRSSAPPPTAIVLLSTTDYAPMTSEVWKSLPVQRLGGHPGCSSLVQIVSPGLKGETYNIS